MSGSRGSTRRSSNERQLFILPLSISFGIDGHNSVNAMDNLDGLIGFTLYNTAYPFGASFPGVYSDWFTSLRTAYPLSRCGMLFDSHESWHPGSCFSPAGRRDD